MKIGKGLKHFRELRGYSQDKLGLACGLRREVVCRLETGVHGNPTARTLKKVLSVLNVSMGEFFNHIGE